MAGVQEKRSRFIPFSIIAILGLVTMGSPTVPVLAGSVDDAQQTAAPNWSKGALFGRVIDTATGKPLADATVALQDKGGKVLAWAKTDAQGQYALAADSLTALQLRPSRRRGFLEKVASGVGKVVTTPVKIVADTVKEVDPVNTGKAAVVSTVTANPAPLTAEAASTIGKGLGDQAAAKAKEKAAKTVLGERQATPKEKRATLVPGEVFLSVTAPGFKELKEKVGAYWLEPPCEASTDGKTPKTGVRAWLETVKLAPAAAADKKSEVENCAVLLSEARAEPGLAAAGTPVKVFVKLATPGNQPLNVRVFAREDKKRTVVELKPQQGAPGVFVGDIPLDADLKPGDTVISLVALKADPIEVKINKDKADALLDFAKGLDDMDADKAYEYDPRIMASENRVDLMLTVLDPKKGAVGAPGAAPNPTPTPPAAPPAAPAPNNPPPSDPAKPPTA